MFRILKETFVYLYPDTSKPLRIITGKRLLALKTPLGSVWVNYKGPFC